MPGIFEQLKDGQDRFVLPYADILGDRFAAITDGSVGLVEGSHPVDPLFGDDPILRQVQMIPMPEGGRAVPRITTAPNYRPMAPGFYRRGQLTDPVLGGWSATPRVLATIARVAKSVIMQDHDGTMERLVRDALVRSMRDGLTDMLLAGVGTDPSGSPPTWEGLGIMNDPGVHGHTYANAGQLADTDILSAVGTLTASRVDEANITALLSPSGFRYCLKTGRSIAEIPMLTGRRLLGLWPAYESIYMPDYLDSTNALEDVGGTMILGDFSYAAIALFGAGVEIQVAGIRDPSEVEIAGLVHYDVGALDPSAFNVITRAAS